MGTSFVEFRGFGFWTRDIFLQSWLTTLLSEIRRTPGRPDWQELLLKEWETQIEIDGGCMALGLDELLSDEQRRGVMLSLARCSVQYSKPAARRTAELFVDLLEGKLKTTTSSPIDYLDGSSQYEPDQN